MRRYSTLLLAAVIGLSACTATAPADDGFDNDGNLERGKVGGGFVIFSNEDKKKEAEASGSEKSSDSEKAASGVEYDTDAPTDYQSYQGWRKARDADSGEYERFRRWQEFEEFLQWKEKQK